MDSISCSKVAIIKKNTTYGFKCHMSFINLQV